MKNRKNRPVNGKVFRSGVYSTAILAAAILLAVLVNLVVRALPSKYTEFDLSEAKMYTLGCDFMPSPIHAGGLRYHGMSPLISQLYHLGYIDEARAFTQKEIFQAAVTFARCQGILPAPESAHALCAVIQEAEKCRDEGKSQVILCHLTGTGYFDLNAYHRFLQGEMEESTSQQTHFQK